MMKQVLITVVIAGLTSFATLQMAGGSGELEETQVDRIATSVAGHPALQSRFTTQTVVVSGESEEDAWLLGVGNDGLPRPGPADDFKSLVEAENAVCFLTEVEFMGMNEANDQLACRVSVDEFTGYWEVHAVQGDGTDASVRCNASCLVIE